MKAQSGLGAIAISSRDRFEVAISRSVSIYFLVLYGLSLPSGLARSGAQLPAMEWAAVVGIPIAVICTALAPKRGTFRYYAAGTAAGLMICGFLLVQLGVIGAGGNYGSRAWQLLMSAGIALAAVAVRPSAAWAYSVVCCLLIALSPLSTAATERQWQGSLQGAVLTGATAAVIIVPITALRRATSALDSAASTAVKEFSRVAKADALKTERSRLDGLTHDTVMATLIVAAQSRSPEVTSAAQQSARESLAQLDLMKTENPGDQSVTGQELVNRVRAATARHPVRKTRVELTPLHDILIPAAVCRALVQSATEAIRNSIRHASGSELSLTVSAIPDPQTGTALVLINVRDDGPGFDVEAVPTRRLGIRVSIVRRMLECGGTAHIRSSPGRGTEISLRWQEGKEDG